MKFNCPKCKKEFVLSRKLAGKQLRVRCTSCGTVFKMRVAGAASSAEESVPAAPRPSEKASAPAPAAAVTHKYFAVIGGKRLGPMPYAALKRLVDEKKITGKTLAWRKGLAEWMPAQQLDELRSLFPAAAPPPLPPRRPGGEPPPLKKAPEPVPEGTREEEARTASPAVVKGKVKGDILTQLRPVEPDEEPTDQEVNLNELDNQFFAHGEAAATYDTPSRDIGEIELGDAPLFPEIEQQTVEKGAKASLQDFSVMVRLSRKSRRKTVFALVALGLIVLGALGAIFHFGDPLGWRDPERFEAEDSRPDGFKGLLAEVGGENRPGKSEAVRTAPKARPPEQQGEDPEALLNSMSEKEWKVTLDEEQMAVDREELGRKLNGSRKEAEIKSNGSSHGSRTEKRHSGKGDEEMSLEEFAKAHQLKKSPAGSLIAKESASSQGGGGVETVGDGVDSAMGNFLGGPRKMAERKVKANVKERAGDGSALKALVARRVAKKVGGERKRIASCVDRFGHTYSGSGGKLRASLHFTDQGAVSRVTIKGGGAELEKCFSDIFDGWRISMINRKIKIPIAVRFE